MYSLPLTMVSKSLNNSPEIESYVNQKPSFIEGKVKKVSTCRPSKPEARQAIKDYLASTPGPDGNTVTVDL